MADTLPLEKAYHCFHEVPNTLGAETVKQCCLCPERRAYGVYFPYRVLEKGGNHD
jgi:hypothetical protein